MTAIIIVALLVLVVGPTAGKSSFYVLMNDPTPAPLLEQRQVWLLSFLFWPALLLAAMLAVGVRSAKSTLSLMLLNR